MRDTVFGTRLMEWLGEHDMSALCFAETAGVHRDVLYQAINGHSTLSQRNLVKICRAHGISADWLLGLDVD